MSSTPKPADRVGSVDVPVEVDIVAIGKRKYPLESAVQPEYGHAQNAENYDIHTGEVLYTYLQKRRKNNSKLDVLSSLNGEGAEEAAKYPNDPEMTRLAIKNKIRPVGVSTTDVKSNVTQYNNGITMVVAGANKVKAWADIAPGQRVAVDVPTNDAKQLYQNTSFRGATRTKFPLVTKPVDSQSNAREAIKHLQESIENPKKWENVMGTSRNTDVWKTFVHNMVKYGEVAGLLMLKKLGEAGKIAFIGDEFEADGGTELSADDQVARLAQYLGVVSSRPDVARLDRTQAGEYNKLRYDIDKAIVYDGKNVANEFGFVRRRDGSSTSSARELANGKVLSSKPQGQMLALQLNQPSRLVASFDDAAQFQRSWQIGVATEGAKRGGHVKLSTNFGN